MATIRQNMVGDLAWIVAMKPPHQRWSVHLLKTIEEYSRNETRTIEETHYLENQNLKAKERFYNAVRRAALDLIEKWEAGLNTAQVETVRSYEAETVDQILEEEAAENLRVIRENAAKIAEYDAWAAAQDQKATVLAVGDLRFVTQVINDDETIFLAIVYDFMKAEWEPRDGVVYYTTSGRCDSFVNTRFPELAAPTFEAALKNVLTWLSAEIPF